MRALTLAAVVVLGACTDKAPPLPKPAATAGTWIDPSPHQSRFVLVNGVSLDVLDWGGTGDGLVLIHGMVKSLFGYHRDDTKVRAPVLALYSERFVSNQLPVADSVRGKVDAWNGEVEAFQKASIARLRRELPARLDVHVLAGTTHPNFPMASRDTMVALIKTFLAKPARSR